MTSKKNYEGILLEEMNDSIKLLAETQIGIRNNVERLAKSQDEMKDDISILKGDVAILKSDVSTLKSDVSTLKSDVSTLKSDVSTLKSELAEFKTDTKEKFDLVMTYLMRIEDELAEIRKEITGIKDGSIPVGNMADMEERITFLEGEVAELKTANV